MRYISIAFVKRVYRSKSTKQVLENDIQVLKRNRDARVVSASYIQRISQSDIVKTSSDSTFIIAKFFSSEAKELKRYLIFLREDHPLFNYDALTDEIDTYTCPIEVLNFMYEVSDMIKDYIGSVSSELEGSFVAVY
jgi:hypothetical protein